MQDLIGRFLRDDTGTTALEYGLLAALISVPLVYSARNMGLAIGNVFNVITNAMK